MQIKSATRTAGGIGALATVMVWSGPAWAQAPATGNPASTSEPAQDSGGLQEVTVTATKREQRNQDVGVTVAALGAETLERERITTLADIADVVPGLDYTQTWVGSPVYTLRGVGFYDASISAYPDVSTYIDQFPLPFPETATLATFDLERIEVVKGPQGTLFGNNATGGAINFVAAKPRSTFEAGGSLGYARFDTIDTEDYVTGPLSDTLNARLAVKVVRSGDWQESYRRDDTIGKSDTSAARLLLDWKPTDTLAVAFNVNGWLNRSDPQVPQFYRSTPQYNIGATGLGGTLTPSAPILNFPAAPFDARAADWDPDAKPSARNNFWQLAGRVDYALNDNLTLTSLTSYLETRLRQEINYDGTDLAAYNIKARFGTIESFGQEFRIDGESARFHWVAGANYEDSQTHDQGDIIALGSTSVPVNGLCCSQYLSDQKLKNYAVFANTEWRMTDPLTFKLGVRETRAEASAISANIEDTACPACRATYSTTDFFNLVWQSLSFIYPNYRPISPGDPYTIDTLLNADGSHQNPATYGTAGAYHGNLRQNSLSWTVGLDYKLADDVLLYTNIAKGYKAGGFPTVSAATWAQMLPVTQEGLLDYEVGFKTQFANHRVMLNGAAFYYDYDDKQTRAKIVDGIFGLLDALVNVPKSKVWGAELEFGWRPFDGFTAQLAGTYLRSEVTQYGGVVASAVDPVTGLQIPVMADFAGVSLPFTPEFQFSGSVQYERPILGRYVGFASFSASAQTQSYSILALTPADQRNYDLAGRALFGAYIGFRDEADRYEVTLWGKNIFNKYYVTNSLLGYDSQIRYAGRPAEYGISAAFKFN